MEKTTNPISHISNKSLSIQVSLSGFCFSVYNKVENKTEIVKNLSIDTSKPILEQLSYYFDEYSSYLYPCDDVRVLYDNNLFTLVPNSYFNEDLLSDYLKYTIKTYPTDSFGYDEIETNNCKVVYVPYMHINNFLLDYYPTFNYQHKITAFINKCVALNITDEKKVYCYVNDSSFDVLVLDGSKIMYCNSFDYQTSEDFLYYVLFALEQIKIDRETAPVYLIGDAKNIEKVFDLAYTYIRNCEILKNTKSTDNSESMHYFILN